MGLDFSIWIIQMANFLLLVFILSSLFWKPASEYMAKRAKYIADYLNEAEAKKKKATELL